MNKELIEQLAKEHGKRDFDNSTYNTSAYSFSIDELEAFTKAFPQANYDDEIQALRAKVASAEVFNLEQILHDPENQPSQYGTVPLEWYENLENKINRIRFNVEQVIDSLSGSYDMHAIRKKLQTAVDEEAYAIWKDKLSEVKQND